MAAITPQDVARIAKMAHLNMSDEELARAAKDLAGVLEHFSVIQSIDTTGVELSDDASDLFNIVREDEVRSEEFVSPSVLLDAAPYTTKNYVATKHSTFD